MSSTAAASDTRSIVVERHMPHSPEKIWRALTQSVLIERFLMRNDFQPIVGHRFHFWAEPVPGWNGVSDCEVLVVEGPKRLVWRQCASGEQAEGGLDSVVAWTITPVEGGSVVRMEHSGFRPVTDDNAFNAMGGGWPRIVERLETVAASS